MKEAVKHSKITFENMLKQWHNLSNKQRQEIQSNIDYLNEQLTIPIVVGELTCDSCGCHPNIISATGKGRFCERCKPAS